MDGLTLYLLGRQLVRLAETSFGRSGADAPPPGVTLVLEDVVTHPDTSIGEIARRTGFPQSHVSTTVARLRERGAVQTSADATDGRRTLVRVTRSYVRTVNRRRVASADADLAEAFGINDPAEAADLVATLDGLAARLLRNEPIPTTEER